MNLTSLNQKIQLSMLLLVTSLLTIAYIIPGVPKSRLAMLSVHYADLVFIVCILILIGYRLFPYFGSKKLASSAKTSSNKPLFWWLLGMAHLSWLTVGLIQWLALPQIPRTTMDLLADSGYFLYYSLALIAIQSLEMKKLSDLLRKQTFSLWISNLVFLLGCYVLLILMPGHINLNSDAKTLSSFIFYLTLDIYLVLRWGYLLRVDRQRQSSKLHWFFAVAIGWTIADALEFADQLQLLHFDKGTYSDWIWYFPFILTAIGIIDFRPSRIRINPDIKMDDGTTRVNNPALLACISLFVGSIYFMLIEKFDINILTHDSTAAIVYLVWLMSLLLLSLEQILRLSKRHQWDQKKLSTINLSHEFALRQVKQQSDALSQASANYRLILETTINPIFTINRTGNILSCNPAAERILGKNREQLIGQNFSDFVLASDPFSHFFQYQTYQEKLRQNRQGLELESKIIGTEDEVIDVHITVSSSSDSDGDVTIISLADIRHQKIAAQEAENLKQEFTSNISHEFRTPLSIIKGVLENLKQKLNSTTELQQIQIAERNNQRLIHMVEQLLDFNRLSHLVNETYVFSANQLIEPIFLSFEALAGQKEINLQWKLNNQSEQPCYILGHAEAMEKILFNLLGNALKYTPAGGEVTISLNSIDDHHAKLVIEDNGVGISQDQLPRIFDRYHRAHQTAQTTHGVGIGLALVKQLIDEMQWRINVYSTMGEGTRIEIAIPLARKEEIATARDIAETTEKIAVDSAQYIEIETDNFATTASKSKRSYSVLFVEDNHDMQKQLAHIFSDSYQCFSALNGDEGIRLALEYLPDLILCDVMMPGISGMQVLKMLRENDLTAHIPVIMLTALGDDKNRLKGLQASADDYITKPFNSAELKLKADNLIRTRDSLKHKLASQWKQDPLLVADGEESNPFLEKMNAIMMQHYSQTDFTLAEFAGAMAVSERQLQRKVKASLDMSPAEALRQFRLKQAQLELQEGAQSGLVAQMCGFSSQTYFGRCFKQEFGVTPKQYQQSVVNES